MNELRRIVLVDLDMTLIDGQYQPSSGSLGPLAETIRLLGQRGVVVGLNSDTPVSSLRWWSDELSLSGPIVAENGQVIALTSSDSPEVLSQNAAVFDSLRRRVLAALLECHPQAFIACGDVTLFRARGGRPHGVDHEAFLVNGLRQCSFSMYALRLEGDRLQPCAALMEQAETIVRRELSFEGVGSQVRLEPNAAYGILIVHEIRASKSLGVRRLMERLGAEYEYFMIGDSKSDIITDTPIPMKMCAVGNACSELKAVSRDSGGVVAERDLTEGVVEILRKFLGAA